MQAVVVCVTDMHVIADWQSFSVRIAKDGLHNGGSLLFSNQRKINRKRLSSNHDALSKRTINNIVDRTCSVMYSSRVDVSSHTK